jgi:hypothetical protein
MAHYVIFYSPKQAHGDAVGCMTLHERNTTAGKEWKASANVIPLSMGHLSVISA